MGGYIQWFLLHCHQSVEAPIPVPAPIHTGRVADLEGLPRGERKAVFLCSQCGLISLYSDADLRDKILGTESPFLYKKLLELICVDARCDEGNCESPIRIHLLWDVARTTLATTIPMNEWRFDDSVRCANGHPPRLPSTPGVALPFYRCAMPF
jgi:hypothetical protein